MTRAHTAVELWYSHRGGATTSALALHKGWLQREFAGCGTVLRSLSEASSRDIRLAHYHHGKTGLLREGSNVPAIWARSQGQQAVVVGITWVDEYQGILALRGSRVRTLDDLAGKRLALPVRRQAMIDFNRASAQRGFCNALRLAGLRSDAASWTAIDAPDFEYPQRGSGREVELEALRSGYVDAVFLRGAAGYAAAQDRRYHQLVDLNTLADPLLRANSGTPRPITVDRPFLERHPDIVARYLAVLLRSARWAARNRAEVAHVVALENPQYAPAHVAGAHGPRLHRSFTPSLSDTAIAGLARQKAFLLEWGYLAQDFDIHGWIDARPLARASALLETGYHASAASVL